MIPSLIEQSLESRDYLEEFYKLDFNDRQESGDDLMINQTGYFMFDVRQLDTYTTSIQITNNLYKANKFHLFGSYSIVYFGIEALIDNNMHLQITMLDIEINDWDSMSISWNLLSKFTNLKLLYIDGCNATRYNKIIPNITYHLPNSLEALSLVNMPYYNQPFNIEIGDSNIKVIKIFALKFNQALNYLPPTLDTLIIESGEFNQSLDNLPGGLNRLILLCPKFNMPLDSLPHGLEYFAGLHFNCFVYPEDDYNLEMKNLPISIKSLLLDKNLFHKQKEKLQNLHGDCEINYYEEFDNFEFIFKNMLERITN